VSRKMPSGLSLEDGLLTSLQKRFVQSGFEGFNDQETIELLLGLCFPARKCGVLAKGCLKQFGNLRGFISASGEELEQVGISRNCVLYIRLLHELPDKILKEHIIKKPIYQSSKEIFDYLYYSMRDLKKEVFKVIYLNSRSQIIDTATLFEGTLDSIPISPREIVETTIKARAAALIFVHNHPSGDPTPSKSDKQLTRDLVFIGDVLQVKVLDHIIIGEDSYFSFADEGLIEKYGDDFLNLKIRGVLDIRPYFQGLGRGFHPK